MSRLIATRVRGVRCLAEVEHYPARDWVQHTGRGCGPGDCSAPEPEDFQIYGIYHSTGRYARLLDRLRDESDNQQIYRDTIAAIQ